MQHFNMTLRDYISIKVKNSKQPRRQQFDGGGGGLRRDHSGAVQAEPTANRVAPSTSHEKQVAVPRLHRTHRRGSSSWSVRSWDSHAHYQDFHNEDEDEEDGGDGENGDFPSSRAIVCYCDMSTFKTPRTILRVLLVVSPSTLLQQRSNSL